MDCPLVQDWKLPCGTTGNSKEPSSIVTARAGVTARTAQRLAAEKPTISFECIANSLFYYRNSLLPADQQSFARGSLQSMTFCWLLGHPIHSIIGIRDQAKAIGDGHLDTAVRF